MNKKCYNRFWFIDQSWILKWWVSQQFFSSSWSYQNITRRQSITIFSIVARPQRRYRVEWHSQAKRHYSGKTKRERNQRRSNSRSSGKYDRQKNWTRYKNKKNLYVHKNANKSCATKSFSKSLKNSWNSSFSLQLFSEFFLTNFYM